MEPVHIPTPDEVRQGMILLLAAGTCLGILTADMLRAVFKWLVEKLSSMAD